MKHGLVLFHSDVDRYPRRWVDKCLETTLPECTSDTYIYEIDYGGKGASILGDVARVRRFSLSLPNHASAQNFIFDRAIEDGCRCVFNVNVDDFYAAGRFSKQLAAIEAGADIVSSDFSIVDSDDEVVVTKGFTSAINIREEFNHNHNVIAHPVVCLSANFWKHNKYNPDTIPEEDFDLWKRAFRSGYKFHIVDDVLLYYRHHPKQVSYR